MGVSLPKKPAKEAFDFLKVFVILGLPWIHIMETTAEREFQTQELSDIYSAVVALTVFGPSIFMICLGIGMASNTKYDSTFKLGIQMLLINFALNLVRFVFPSIFDVIQGTMELREMMYDAFGSDIYYFVGYFMIFYAFIMGKGCSLRNFVILSIVLLILNSFLSQAVYIDEPISGAIAGNFVSGFSSSYFPLLGWTIYPCIGILLGRYVINKDASYRNKFFAGMAVLSAVVLAVASYISIQYADGPVEALVQFVDDSVYGFLQVALILSCSMLLISIVYFIYMAVPKNKLEDFILPLSPLILPYYIIQWILCSFVTYYYFTFAPDPVNYSVLGYLIMSIVVVVLSAFLTYRYGFSMSCWMLKKTDYTRWFK